MAADPFPAPDRPARGVPARHERLRRQALGAIGRICEPAILLRDPRVCCWEICEINPHPDTLSSIGDISLGVYATVMEKLPRRLVAPGAGPVSLPPGPR